MKAVLALSWRLLRSGDGRNKIGAVLVLAAVAASTALLMFAIAANHAFGERVTRDAWRYPERAAHGTAVQALSTDYVRGTPITVVDLATKDRAEAPVPPGMRSFPKPGEVWVSPALAKEMRDLPRDELADRFPGHRAVGVLGKDAVVHPDELVAVIGRSLDDPAISADRADGEGTRSATPITRYADDVSLTGLTTTGPYRLLAQIATVLMVVPLLVFGGAAARLTVARRDQRLAALRLVGATPRQVVAMTVVEAIVTAFFGALVGIAVYAAVMPALAGITMQGGPWYLSDVWPGFGWASAALLAVPLLVGASAVVGLRRIVVSPLGVANRQTPPALKAVRAVVAVALILAFPLVTKATGGRVAVGVTLMLLALAFLALNLVGPWVVSLIGRIAAATAKRPARLLAGRRLVDDPRSSWRTVSGVAMVGFVVGMLALFDPNGGFGLDTNGSKLSASTSTARTQVTAELAEKRLAAHHVDAKVTTEPRSVIVTLSRENDVDRARTALVGVAEGHIFTSRKDEQRNTLTLLRDIKVGAYIVLAVSFVIAMVSAGITSVSTVLDRRRAFALLRLAGTPMRVLNRARLLETMLPLAVMGGGALAAGLVCGLPLAASSPATPYGLTLFAAFVGLGVLGVVGANALSRPLLRSVTSSPSPQPD